MGIATAVLAFFVANIILYLAIYCFMKVNFYYNLASEHYVIKVLFCSLLWRAVDLVGFISVSFASSILGRCLPLLWYSDRMGGELFNSHTFYYCHNCVYCFGIIIMESTSFSSCPQAYTVYYRTGFSLMFAVHTSQAAKVQI